MIQQTELIQNDILKKINRASLIKYHLKILGITQKSIAKELNISEMLLSKVIRGESKSKRVEVWLKENLGV